MDPKYRYNKYFSRNLTPITTQTTIGQDTDSTQLVLVFLDSRQNFLNRRPRPVQMMFTRATGPYQQVSETKTSKLLLQDRNLVSNSNDLSARVQASEMLRILNIGIRFYDTDTSF